MVKITKWFEDKAPKETDFRNLLESEGFTVDTQSEEAGVMQDPTPSDKEKSLVVLKGMARITLPDLPEDFMDLMAGDRLDIPKGTNHGLMIGPAGATILEGKK
ncbi:MAG: hypothetical protein IH859_01880 [Chloroflexi bacterium]|nr:hypothetical protein [Chloroflexota bacterium]